MKSWRKIVGFGFIGMMVAIIISLSITGPTYHSAATGAITFVIGMIGMYVALRSRLF